MCVTRALNGAGKHRDTSAISTFIYLATYKRYLNLKHCMKLALSLSSGKDGKIKILPRQNIICL